MLGTKDLLVLSVKWEVGVAQIWSDQNQIWCTRSSNEGD
jgi:hypothetical protein